MTTLGSADRDLVEGDVFALKRNMQFGILGPVEAVDGDRLVVSGSGKPAEVLALLLSRAN